MAEPALLKSVRHLTATFKAAAGLVQAIPEAEDEGTQHYDVTLERRDRQDLLHISLVESERRCRAVSQARARRFGTIFERGDDTALSELKDILKNLKSNVMNPLMVATSGGAVALDLRPLSDNSLAYSVDAAWEHSDSNLSASPLPDYFTPYQPPPHSRTQTSLISVTPRYQAVDLTHSHERLPRSATSNRAPVAIATSNLFWARHRSGYGLRQQTLDNRRTFDGSDEHIDVSEYYGDDYDQPAPSYRTTEEGEASSRASRRTSHISTSRTGTPLSDSAFLSRPGMDNSVARTSSPSPFTSGVVSRRASTPSSLDSPAMPTPLSAMETLALQEVDAGVEAEREIHASETLPAGLQQSLSHQSPLSPYRATSSNSPGRADMPCGRGISEASSPYPSPAWVPLSLPNEDNIVYNFCPGAWKTRQFLTQGLETCQVPDANGVVVEYWKCRDCQFRSKAIGNEKPLPAQISFNNHEIRYRWCFLAKSHVMAQAPRSRPEQYAYACIFCVAEGRASAIHEPLESLMRHISSKHKAHAMEAATLKKLNCVIGSPAADTDDWDINICSTASRTIGSTMSDYFMSATTGISRAHQVQL